MQYRFGPFALDVGAFELRGADGVRHVEPMVFDLIVFLVECGGRIVTRDQIIDRVWKGRIVSDATVASCIKSARKALDDSGERQDFIRTVRGRGVQFVASVTRDPEPGDEAAMPAPVASEAADEAPSARATRRPPPSLVVLPFDVFGADPSLTPIADGIVENLTTLLTRVPLLALASRTSSFAFKGQPVIAQEVGKRLGVDYLIEGSLQRAGARVRLNVQLIETRNGFHLWAEQFDHADDDAAIEDLTVTALARLEPQVVRAIFNALRDESGELTAGQLLLQASSVLSIKGWHRTTFTEAAGMLRRAIAMEPGLALAHAYLALTMSLGHRVGLLEQSSAIVREAVQEADLALEIDDMDSNVVGVAGCAIADVGFVPRALPILNKALRLNPKNGQAWAALGAAHAKASDWPPAVEALERGVAISPMDGRLAVWRSILALCHLQMGDAGKALDVAVAGCESDDRNYLPRLALTAIRIARQEPVEARAALAECLRVKPDLSEQEIACMVGTALCPVIAALRAEI